MLTMVMVRLQTTGLNFGLQILSVPVAPAVSSSTTAKSAWAYGTPAATEECGQCASEIDSSVFEDPFLEYFLEPNPEENDSILNSTIDLIPTEILEKEAETIAELSDETRDIVIIENQLEPRSKGKTAEIKTRNIMTPLTNIKGIGKWK